MTTTKTLISTGYDNAIGATLRRYSDGSVESVEASEPSVEEAAASARRAASDLRDLLSQGCTVRAHELDGSWYVVTSGTGEGTFAYAVDDDDDPLDLEAGWVRCEDGDRADRTRVDDDGEEVEERWDYSTWCASSVVGPEDDLRVAVAYYLAEGDRLNRGGACDSILSDEQIAALNAISSRANR